MKVLFIDDEVFRFDRMIETGNLESTAVHVDNAIKAIDAIVDDGPWDVIFFDHDLATFVQDPYKREITGNDVAKVLVRQDWKPKQVIIHSTNSAGANNVFNTLNDVDIPATIYPFPKFMEDAYRKSTRVDNEKVKE
jgi:hypothetical protein